MRKVFRLLAVADLIMLLTAVIFWLMTRNANDLSGTIVFYPLTAFIFITVAIMVLGFVNSLRQTAYSGGANAFKLLGRVLLLLGVPMLGLYYATHGQNRGGLVVISTVGLLLGLIATSALIIKQVKL